jgi:hypothetical protein
MPLSPNLSLPLLEAGQAQKHVTLNEALRIVDAAVQLRVLDRADVPPSGPEPGESYLIGETPSGAFAGRANGVALYEDNAWRFLTPQSGWRLWIEAETRLLVFDGAAWQDFAALALSGLDSLGINTEASPDNRLTVRSNAALLHAIEAADGGTGDARLQLSKETAADTASVVFSENFSGRAEFGLNGSSDFSLKVSGDGSGWSEALVIDRTNGKARFPNGIIEPASGHKAPYYLPLPVQDIWRADVTRPGTPRTATIASVAGNQIALTAAVTAQFGRWDILVSSAYLRIWNTSKSPAQSAWIASTPDGSTLQVLDAAAIAGWSPGETLRLGDPNPTGLNTLGMVAVDLSRYLAAHLGTVVPQSGVFLSLYVSSAGGSASLDVSGTGASGTASGGNALSDGVRNQTSLPVATPVPSPISNSNLLFFREQLAGTATAMSISFARMMGVYL